MVLKTRQSIKEQPDWLRQSILLGNQFHYRQKNVLAHNALNLSVLLLILLGVGGLLFLGTVLPGSLFIPIGAVGFGLCYFILFILVVHEASHGMFIHLKNARQAQRWNRLLGWIVCLPFRTDYGNQWEKGHLIHHFDPATSHDPQNCPESLLTGIELCRYLSKVLFVPGYVIVRKGLVCPTAKDYPNQWFLNLGTALVWVSAISLETIYLGWPVAIASLLGIQILVTLNTLKITMEHGGAVGSRSNDFLRACSSFFPLRSLIMPLNISIHFEHHLNYSVPWYDLMKYHHVIKDLLSPEVKEQVFHQNIEVWHHILDR